MSTYEKVKGYSDLSKNPNSGSVINTNVAEYNNARIRAGRIKTQENRMKALESELTEIKQLLKGIAANGNS